MAKKKSDTEKRLAALAKQYGATLSADGDGFVLQASGARNVKRVAGDLSVDEWHGVERYLKGAGS